jgi:hypothetical protein
MAFSSVIRSFSIGSERSATPLSILLDFGVRLAGSLAQCGDMHCSARGALLSAVEHGRRRPALGACGMRSRGGLSVPGQSIRLEPKPALALAFLAVRQRSAMTE